MNEDELNQIIKKISAKALKEEAKARGMKTHCVKKIDLAKNLPEEVVIKLAEEAE